MSTKYAVEFFSIPDNHAPSADLLALAMALVRLIRDSRCDWPRIGAGGFVFRVVRGATFRVPPFNSIDVSRLYGLQLSRPRALLEDEASLCALLQKLLGLCASRREIDKVLSVVLEELILEEKAGGGKNASKNQGVKVNGLEVVHAEKHEIDIVLDQLDAEDILELCECSLTRSGFKDPSKLSQINFYSECLLKIRRLIGPTPKLRLRLVAATPDGRHWDEITIQRLGELKHHGIDVDGRTYWDETYYSFD
jgi:hypothetical protein